MALHLDLSQEELQEVARREEINDARLYWREPTPAKILAELKKTKSAGFSPSTIQARQVQSLIALGLTVKEIAETLLIEQPLLKFFYKRELLVGAVLVNARVGHVALQMALSGTNPTMTQFWLARRAGWKETQIVEQTIEVRAVSEARSKLLGDKPPIEGAASVIPEDQRSLAGPSTETRQ